MPPFASHPLRQGGFSRSVRKNPALFGVPFLMLMVGASYGMSYFTQTKYDLQDQRVSTVRMDVIAGFLIVLMLALGAVDE